MMYEFVNKYTVKKAGNPVRKNRKVYSNPTDKTLRELGYKELVVAPIPEVDNTKEVIPVYTEDGSVIKQDWEIVDYVEN